MATWNLSRCSCSAVDCWAFLSSSRYKWGLSRMMVGEKFTLLDGRLYVSFLNDRSPFACA